MTLYFDTIGTGDSIGTGTFTVSSPLVDTTNRIIVTSSGTSVKLTQEKNISPKLYFSFVKSKLTPVEVVEVKRRLKYLSILAEAASEVGQRGLLEDIEKQMYVIIKDVEAVSCGFSKFVNHDDIYKFRYLVKDKTIGFSNLSNYPRPIPTKVRSKIKKIQEKEIFDEYWILYNDPMNTPLSKTTADKIKEKDPILFGKFKYDETRYFYLLDWVDEYCDLTLKSFVTELKKEKINNQYSVGELKELTAEDMESIKKRVIDRAETINNTTSSNWKELERLQRKIEELENSKTQEVQVDKEVKKWWKFW